MEIAFTEWVPVTDASSVGEVRRIALHGGAAAGGSTRPDQGNLRCWQLKLRAMFWSMAAADRWCLRA